MRRPGTRVSMVALAAVAATTLMSAPSTSAAPLPANTIPTGTATLAPTTGTAATNFGFTLPGGAACPGDGTAGYRWQTFIVPNASDASQLVFTGGNPTIEYSDLNGLNKILEAMQLSIS